MNNSIPSVSSLKNPPRYFYVAASFLMLALVFFGFQLFYLHGQAFPGRPLTPPIRTLVILHGVAMSAWIILFVLQPLLIAKGDRRTHMRLGKLGGALALIIVVLGWKLAVGSAAVNPPELKLWGLVPKQFLVIPISALVLFATFVAIGIWKRRTPSIHRAMMLLATLAAVTAAIDRIPAISNLYNQTAVGQFFGPYFAPVVIGAAFFLGKTALTRTFNRAFAVGLLVLAATGPLVLHLAHTSAWETFTAFTVR